MKTTQKERDDLYREYVIDEFRRGHDSSAFRKLFGDFYKMKGLLEGSRHLLGKGVYGDHSVEDLRLKIVKMLAKDGQRNEEKRQSSD